MSADNPSDPKRELTDDDADRLTYEAMKRDGKFVPQTPEEVARAEAEVNEAAVELPPALRDPLTVLNTSAPTPEAQPAEPSTARTPSTGTPDEARRTRFRKRIVWSIVVGVIAAVPVYQLVAWQVAAADVRAAERALQTKQDEFKRLLGEAEAKRKETRKDVDAALAAEAELAKQYRAAHEAARKAIEEKEFVVRLTGPEHIQPGAPNKWQIETLKGGAVGRPKKLDVVVRDAKDAELFRQTHDKPVGVATLELGPAFWSKVKPGTDLFLHVVAQTDDGRDSVLAERLPLARPVYVTHLVTDKPLYKPGETVRFRSLTLDRSTLQPPQHDLHLIFKLRDPGDAVTVLEEGNGRLLSDLKPVMGPDKKPLRGIGVGEFALPAEAPGGEYKLDLFEVSRDTQKEVLIETRKFVVNRYVPDTFEKKLEFDGKSYGPGEFVQARIDVSRPAGGPMKNATANVVAAADGKTFHEQKGAKFVTTADATGTRTVLDVRFKLPAEVFEKKDGAPNATLSVNIQDGSDAEAIVRPIPLVTKNLKIEFFPEGGEMIEGVPGRVYFMVRTPIGKPADIKGYVTDGTEKIEVATLTDAENPGVNRGHGVFTLIPKAGAKYFLKLNSPAGITEPTKDGFPLPAAKSDGVALTALDAVTARGGAIRVRVQSPTGPKTLHVGAYVRERLVAQQKVTAEANKPVEVSLKGDESAGGVTRVTVFEELKTDDPRQTVLAPRAERLVFRGSGERLALNASPDKLRYSPSDKVRLDLSAVTEKGTPTPAVLMVGVVNRSVITMADNKTDRLMPTHFLISGDVKNAAELEHADFLLTDHPKAGVALDLLLGTQGWRRFAEQEVALPNPADKPDVDKMLVAHGQRPSAPLQLVKLEEQRVNAEFAPQVETARLRTAKAADEWDATNEPTITKALEARTEVSAAESKVSEAESAAGRYESRFEDAGYLFARLFVLGLIGAAVFFTFRKALAESADEALVRRQWRIAGGVTLAVCGVLLAGYYFLFEGKHAAYYKRGAPAPSMDAMRERVLTTTAERDAMDWFAAAQMRGVPIEETEKLKLNADRAAKEAELRARVYKSFMGIEIEEGLGFKRPARLKTMQDELTVTRSRGRRLDPLAWANAPDDSITRLRKKTGALSDRLRVASEFSKARGVSTRFTKEGSKSELMEDMVQLAIPESVLRGHSFAESMYGKPVPPFVVREYAHQRDPALGEVRSDFTETVYWHPVLALPDTGKATVEFQLSDDIARYQVLVAGHTLDGRIGAFTTTIEARKPFSVDPKLPLEISHTDTVDVPLRVTNDSDARRTVSLATTATGFKSASPMQDVISLDPNGKGRKFIRLTADKLAGDASLLVEGTSGADKDAIARTIRVVPDGFPRVGSVSDMLEKGRARGGLVLPKDTVAGSLKVRVEMYPTSMADLVKGLDGLLREPYGCFEQTSTTNYPNTLILDYLNASNQANPEATKRAKELLAKGYGRLTGFECPDTPLKVKHGFEWFGAADRQHEALTAYGLLQFKDMARVHPVDPELIKRTQAFLMSRRDGQGGFARRADGHTFGMAPKHTVDAYIVWALVESDPDDVEKLDLRKEIAALKAEALNANSEGGKDAYFVALTANVMLLRNEREAAHKLLDRLKDKHVKEGRVTGAVTSVTRSGGRDLEIETTALALLGWLRANDPTYGTTVKDATRWISQQRGGYGGFGSTQSTIMALKALSLYAKKSAHPAEAGELKLVAGGKVVASRKFTEQDVDVIGLDVPNPEEVFKPGERTEIEIQTDAKQPYPIALGYVYTSLTPVSAEQCAVKISTKLGRTEATEGDTVPLAVTLENKLKKAHGMAVAIIGLPAGMKVPTDVKQLTDLREKGVIAYFETRDRELILYWRELAPEQKIALTVDLECAVPGTYRGPASRGYLYYDADHKHWVEPLSVKINPMKE